MRMNKDKLINLLFVILFIVFIAFGAIFFTWVIVEFNAFALVCTILCVIATIVFFTLSMIKEKGYKIKYYYSNKKYNQEIVKVLSKFDGAPQEFIDRLKRTTKKTYRYCGNLFGVYYSEWLYKNKEIKETLLNLYTKLYNSILSKGGFVEFFKQIEDKNMSSYTIYEYLTYNLVSNELSYLLRDVYAITDYTVYDNGLSEEFTIKNNKMIDDLNNIYSPLLFKFKDEIEKLIDKLK